MNTSKQPALVYRFRPYVGWPHEPFLGNPEDCGYRRCKDGNWTDWRNNTGCLESWEFCPQDDWSLAVEAWSDAWLEPDFEGEEGRQFRRWLIREMGFTGHQAYETWQVVIAQKSALLHPKT